MEHLTYSQRNGIVDTYSWRDPVTQLLAAKPVRSAPHFNDLPPASRGLCRCLVSLLCAFMPVQRIPLPNGLRYSYNKDSISSFDICENKDIYSCILSLY